MLGIIHRNQHKCYGSHQMMYDNPGGAPQSVVNTADTLSDLGIITRQTDMKILVVSKLPRCQKHKTPRECQAWLPEITQVMQHHPLNQEMP